MDDLDASRSPMSLSGSKKTCGRLSASLKTMEAANALLSFSGRLSAGYFVNHATTLRRGASKANTTPITVPITHRAISIMPTGDGSLVTVPALIRGHPPGGTFLAQLVQQTAKVYRNAQQATH